MGRIKKQYTEKTLEYIHAHNINTSPQFMNVGALLTTQNLLIGGFFFLAAGIYYKRGDVIVYIKDVYSIYTTKTETVGPSSLEFDLRKYDVFKTQKFDIPIEIIFPYNQLLKQDAFDDNIFKLYYRLHKRTPMTMTGHIKDTEDFTYDRYLIDGNYCLLRIGKDVTFYHTMELEENDMENINGVMSEHYPNKKIIYQKPFGNHTGEKSGLLMCYLLNKLITSNRTINTKPTETFFKQLKQTIYLEILYNECPLHDHSVDTTIRELKEYFKTFNNNKITIKETKEQLKNLKKKTKELEKKKDDYTPPNPIGQVVPIVSGILANPIVGIPLAVGAGIVNYIIPTPKTNYTEHMTNIKNKEQEIEDLNEQKRPRLSGDDLCALLECIDI
jgi:hypothetical protein